MLKRSALLLTLSLTPALALSVPHELGTAELKAPAKRVVALEYSFVDTLLSLGVKPVGAALGSEGGDRGAPPYLAPLTKDIPAVGSRIQPSLEKIAASKPDLILSDTLMHKEIYPALSKMAPTVSFESRHGDLNELNSQTLKIGQMVGREAIAKRLLADQKTLIQKARAFAQPKAPPFVVAVVTGKNVTVHTNESFVGSFLENLGRKNALKPRGSETQYQISLEGLVGMQPQSLILLTAPDEKPLTAEWQKNPLWQKLPAVQRGRVYTFNRDDWSCGRGPKALKLMIAQAIESRFLQDGAPSGNYKY